MLQVIGTALGWSDQAAIGVALVMHAGLASVSASGGPGVRDRSSIAGAASGLLRHVLVPDWLIGDAVAAAWDRCTAMALASAGEAGDMHEAVTELRTRISAITAVLEPATTTTISRPAGRSSPHWRGSTPSMRPHRTSIS